MDFHLVRKINLIIYILEKYAIGFFAETHARGRARGLGGRRQKSVIGA